MPWATVVQQPTGATLSFSTSSRHSSGNRSIYPALQTPTVESQTDQITQYNTLFDSLTYHDCPMLPSIWVTNSNMTRPKILGGHLSAAFRPGVVHDHFAPIHLRQSSDWFLSAHGPYQFFLHLTLKDLWNFCLASGWHALHTTTLDHNTMCLNLSNTIRCHGYDNWIWRDRLDGAVYRYHVVYIHSG